MTEERAMDDGVERLRGKLRDAVDLIRRSGGGVVFEKFPGALQEEPPPDEPADGPDDVVDAVDALAETLAQLEAPAWRTPS